MTIAQELINALQFTIKTSATELSSEPRQQRIAINKSGGAIGFVGYFLFASFSFVPQKKKKTTNDYSFSQTLPSLL
jgi:hypothetical protein